MEKTSTGQQATLAMEKPQVRFVHVVVEDEGPATESIGWRIQTRTGVVVSISEPGAFRDWKWPFVFSVNEVHYNPFTRHTFCDQHSRSTSDYPFDRLTGLVRAHLEQNPRMDAAFSVSISQQEKDPHQVGLA